ncbi:MAG: IgGFc-binding protein, partial [Bacteroidota bacterium]
MVFMVIRYRFVCLLLAMVVASASALTAQVPPLDEMTSGRHYIVAFPDTVRTVLDQQIKYQVNDSIAILIYSAVDNRIVITAPDYNRTVTLQAGKFATIYVNDVKAFAPHQFVDVVGQVSDATFRLDAAEPVVVYCYMMTQFGGEGWTPLPVEAWGQEYFAATQPGETVQDVINSTGIRAEDSVTAPLVFLRQKQAPAEILIIAAFDGTTVSIEPTSPLQGSSRTEITLNAGQCYQVQSIVDTNRTRDTTKAQTSLAGSIVKANHPIGVLSGNTRGSSFGQFPGFEEMANPYHNMEMEWLAPIECQGKEFVVVPDVDTRRMIKDNVNTIEPYARRINLYGISPVVTHVQETGDSIPSTTIDLPQKAVQSIVSKNLSSVFLLHSSQPIQVMNLASAVAYKSGGIEISAEIAAHGSYMTEVVPREQWSSFVPYSVPDVVTGMRHFISVVADSGSRGLIYKEDGTPFKFNPETIKGTDLIFGSDSVT